MKPDMNSQEKVSEQSRAALHSGRVLIMTAVEAERQAVLRGIGDSPIFDVKLAGFGPASAAARTAAALPCSQYGLVISAGIAGGFPGKADIGTIVVANRIIAADLGAETPDGFLSVDELGFGSSVAIPEPVLVQALTDQMRSAGISVHSGPILTVTTGTGSAERTAALTARISEAAAEGMEGFGVATAAGLWSLPVLEVRAISNAVGPRDRSAWRMKEAFEALEIAGAHLRRLLTE